jgi:hypothetical protein
LPWKNNYFSIFLLVSSVKFLEVYDKKEKSQQFFFCSKNGGEVVIGYTRRLYIEKAVNIELKPKPTVGSPIEKTELWFQLVVSLLFPHYFIFIFLSPPPIFFTRPPTSHPLLK